jgi:hypothetical protein
MAARMPEQTTRETPPLRLQQRPHTSLRQPGPMRQSPLAECSLWPGSDRRCG